MKSSTAMHPSDGMSMRVEYLPTMIRKNKKHYKHHTTIHTTTGTSTTQAITKIAPTPTPISKRKTIKRKASQQDLGRAVESRLDICIKLFFLVHRTAEVHESNVREQPAQKKQVNKKLNSMIKKTIRKKRIE
jgi:hypothetical protein